MIKQNPEWLSDTIIMLQLGIEERLKDEMQYSTDIEVGFINILDKKPKKELILKGLKALRKFGGTVWQKEKIKKFSE